MEKDAVVLLSGGIDSSTTLCIALERGFRVHALTVDYGQRNRVEVEAARKVANAVGVVDHRTIGLDLRVFGGSSLISEMEVPKDRPESSFGREIPSTYVPARNSILLSLALGMAEAIGAHHVFIGANMIDYSGYPDCRPEFLAAFEIMANLGTRDGMEGQLFHVEAPLIRMGKAEIIRKGVKLGLDYSLTTSCYDPLPDGIACGQCESCRIRHRGFREAGVEDPTRYATNNPEE